MAGKTETFGVQLSKPEYARLEKEARARGMSVQDYAGQKVIRSLESHQNPQQEAACAEIFEAIIATGASEVTLFLFDFGNQGSVSYKTDLDDDVIATVRAGLKHLKGGTPFAAMEPVSPEALRAFGESVATLAPGVGFALFCGRGTPTGYVSNSDREDVVRMLETDVLPQWSKIALARATVEMHEAKEDLAHEREQFMELLTPEQLLEIEKLEKRIRGLIIPRATSAGNLETVLMSFAYLLAPSLCVFADRIDGELELREDIMTVLSAASTPVYEVTRKFRSALGPYAEQDIFGFAMAWLNSSFARLEVGHKLAASLCLTDIPDEVEVRAPWRAWSLVLPDGLLTKDGFITSDGKLHGPIARVWIMGTTVKHLVTTDGAIDGETDTHFFSEAAMRTTPGGTALSNLIRGACLALSNPDDFKKERRHAPSAHSSKRKTGAPDFEQAKFLLSAPVQIDFREHLETMLSGKKGHGSSPTAQFLVRGHWRNQAHGPRRSLRRAQWIQPFWKGDPEARVLLRQHRVEEPTEP